MEDEIEIFKKEIKDKTLDELKCLLAMGYTREKYNIIMKTYLDKKKEIDKRKELSTIKNPQRHKNEQRMLQNYKYNNIPSYKISKYKQVAKTKGLDFLLTDEQCIELFNEPCWYCGYVNDTLNGIDRIDSNKGYTTDNCISCCKICNYFKGTLTQEQFFNQIKKIHEKHFEI